MVHPRTTFPRLDWMFIASMLLCEVMHADFSPGFKGGEQPKKGREKRNAWW